MSFRFVPKWVTLNGVVTSGEPCRAVLPLFASYAPSGVKLCSSLWLPRLFCFTWTTATACCMVWQLHWSGVFSLYRMPLRGSYSVYSVPSTFLLHSSAFIGCASLSASLANWQFWHIKPFMALDRVISSPASLASQTCRHDDDCVRPSLIACTYRSFVDPQLAVAHSQLPVPQYGTTCRLTSQLRRHSRSSDSALRYFCSRAHTLTLSVKLQTMYFLHLGGPSNNFITYRRPL